MRLLKLSSAGGFQVTDDLADDELPPYAILSHRWEEDESQEVTFEDMSRGNGWGKTGYKKIQFCSEQAISHGLQYFWVDSCCIDKQNKAELSHTIRSMFRWYRNASRCYVYLSDVSLPGSITGDENGRRLWIKKFQNSKWFTRGWTLQELLAPPSVEFFSCEKLRLGDKISLQHEIHKTTAIPLAALNGAPFLSFTVRERYNWIEHRETTHAEDRAYSLFGIFGVSLLPIYGEGANNAFSRLQAEIDKLELCLQALHCTDPRKDKKRIEAEKDGLFGPSYQWILEHDDFRSWRDDEGPQLLWIKGDPGKGKTMLICGIIDELEHRVGRRYNISYFFCQATDSRINNATAVLRGLLFSLIVQQPSLHSHIQRQLEHAGSKLFDDANAWVTVSDIFENVLRDVTLEKVYLVIDALDECVVELPKLLDFVVRVSSLSLQTKWLVSARNWPSIEERMDRVELKMRLSLELNAESISRAVGLYIGYRSDQLAQEKKLSNEVRDAIFDYLSSNADETFLWIALVYQRLKEVKPWSIVTSLRQFPPGLYPLYERMFNQVTESDDAELCLQILKVSVLVCRPITLAEVTCLVSLPEEITHNREWLQEIVALCGSFLAVREESVNLVHQSAKEYLLEKGSHILYPTGLEDGHYQLFSRSMEAISKTLKRDIYGLEAPGYCVQDLKIPNPDPLAACRYSILYWADHLQDWYMHTSAHLDNESGTSGLLYTFLVEKYLFWLEALSLCGCMPQGVMAMIRLKTLCEHSTEYTKLFEFVADALRFVLFYQGAIRSCPLQVYASPLIFSPRRSLVKRFHRVQKPKWIKYKTTLRDAWGSCFASLEGHGGGVLCVAFSPDSKRVASASEDTTIRLWDSRSGTVLSTLKGHTDQVVSVMFSPNGERIVSASADDTVRLWDAQSGEALATLKDHSWGTKSALFSPNGKSIATHSRGAAIKLWDAESGVLIAALEGHRGVVTMIRYSPNGMRIASASSDSTIKLWDTETGVAAITLTGHGSPVECIAFSSSGKYIVSASEDNIVRLWDSESGKSLMVLNLNHGWGGLYHGLVISLALLHDGRRILSALQDYTAILWDVELGIKLAVFDHKSRITEAIISPDGRYIVLAGSNGAASLWDADSGKALATLEGHNKPVVTLAFSPDSTCIASGSMDQTINLWDVYSGDILLTPICHSEKMGLSACSPDGQRLVLITSARNDLELWDSQTGLRTATLKDNYSLVNFVAFSPNSAQLVSSNCGTGMILWSVQTGMALQATKVQKVLTSLNFFPNNKRIACASFDTIYIYDVQLNRFLNTLQSYYGIIQSITVSSDGNRIAAALFSSDENTYSVTLWDVESSKELTRYVLNRPGRPFPSSLAFSSDSKYIALACTDVDTVQKRYNRIILWDIGLEQNTPIQDYVGSDSMEGLRFSAKEGQFETNRGNLLVVQSNDSLPHLKRTGLFVSDDWIMFGEQKLLWLPPEHRPGSIFVKDDTISIVSRSGPVSFYWIDISKIPGLQGG